MNEQVVLWHLLEDVFGWLAIFLTSIVMIIRDIHILDPILSILITTYILWNVAKNFKKVWMIFLQGVPGSLYIVHVENKIVSLPKIRSLHDTHIWSLDGERNILTTHVVVDKIISNDEIVQIKCKVKDLTKKIGIYHITIEIEREGEICKLENY